MYTLLIARNNGLAFTSLRCNDFKIYVNVISDVEYFIKLDETAKINFNFPMIVNHSRKNFEFNPFEIPDIHIVIVSSKFRIECDTVTIFVNKVHPKPFFTIDGLGNMSFPKTKDEQAKENFYDYIDRIEVAMHESLTEVK